MVLFDPNSTEHTLFCCVCSGICGFKAWWANTICFCKSVVLYALYPPSPTFNAWLSRTIQVRKRNGECLIDRHDLSFETSFSSYEDAPYPMHTACWDILEACWDYMESRPFDFVVLADILIAQPRLVSDDLDAYSSTMACWNPLHSYGRLTGGILRREVTRAPDDFSYVPDIDEQEHYLLSAASRRVVISKRQMGNTQLFSTPYAIDRLPPELCLQILCYLPTISVKVARLASRAVVDVPLVGTYWKSRFSRPDLSHIPRSSFLVPSKTHGKSEVYLRRMLWKCRDYNFSRELTITQAEAIIKMVRQRRKVLGLPAYPRLPGDVVCHRFLSVFKYQSDGWQLSDKLSEWRSLVIFDRETPILSCYEVTLIFTPSYGGRYLSGIEFHFPQHKLALGYTEVNTEWAVEEQRFRFSGVEKQKFRHDDALVTSSAEFGFTAIRGADEVECETALDTKGSHGADDDCKKSRKSLLFPAKSSQICGFQAVMSVVRRRSIKSLQCKLNVYRTTVSSTSDCWSLRTPRELQLIV